jgi:hypothetical protein
MTPMWKILLEIEGSAKEELELEDAKSYFDGYLKIKRNYFDRLAKAIKISKKYITKRGIERVTSPNNEDWTLNPWFLLLLKENEKNMSFWLLIRREKDLSGTLIAIGPKIYADFNNQNLPDSKRDLKRLINFIVSYVNKFDCLIILPNFLS